jgi:ABC-type molybdenum transport system ATPase subunit/photorepair protein PhrA
VVKHERRPVHDRRAAARDDEQHARAVEDAMKLTKIDVRRLHGRLTMSVPTDRPVLFIGPNGAGKSSLLNAALAVMLCDPSGFGPQPPAP